jgi:putative membrane protein
MKDLKITGGPMKVTLKKVGAVGGATFLSALFGYSLLLARQETPRKHSTRTDEARADKSATFDEEFARKAAEANLAEIKLGQLAQEKASSQTVKQFAKQMVEDHSKANEELKEAANKEGITLPNDLDQKEKAKIDELSRLSGPAFDKAYAREMVRDHEKDVAEFRRAASMAKKEEIKEFASKTEPKLEEHLTRARQMMQEVSRAGMDTGRTGKRSNEQR